MAGGGEERRLFVLAVLVAGAVTLLRIVVLIYSPLELYPDEAQYWWWAQTPDFGYFSKPPLIAWLISLSTSVFGNAEWAIRLPIPLLHAGAALFVYGIARASYPDDARIPFWSALAYLTLPGVSYSCSLCSTDAPLLFFWSAALCALLRGAQAPAWRWALLCGAAIGFGLLSKYAMAFFVLGTGVALMANERLRHFLAGRYGCAVVAAVVLVILPNLLWNARHGFPTVVHLGSNADWSKAGFAPLHAAGFLLGQFGVFGPVLMAAWLAGLWRLLRQRPPVQDSSELYAFSAPIILLIVLQALVARANANWAAAAYVSAVPLAVAEIRRSWPRVMLALSYALNGAVLLLLCLLMLRPALAGALGLADVFKREEGWRALAATVEKHALSGGFALTATDNRSITAEMLYYAPRLRRGIRIWDSDGTNHNHFEMTIRLAPPAPRTLLVLPPADASAVLATFESVRFLGNAATPIDGAGTRVLALYDARGYRGTARH